jgi:hypothetical protein
VRAWRPETLAMTHFGAAENVDEHLDELNGRLDRWAALARGSEQQQFIDSVHAEIASKTAPEVADAVEKAAAADQLYQGLKRYWRKRAPEVS